MKKCKECGYKNSDSAKYCRNCGNDLADAEQKGKQQKKSGRSHIFMKMIGIVLLLAAIYIGICTLTGRKFFSFQKNPPENADRYYFDDLHCMEINRESLTKGTNGISFVKNQLIVTVDCGVSKETVEMWMRNMIF